VTRGEDPRVLGPARRRASVLGRPGSYLEAGGGRPVVLIHGAAGRAEVWSPQLTGLADVARMIAVDLPGHGATEGQGCQEIERYAAWVTALLDALGVDRPVLVGHSMGGAIAQTLALGDAARYAGLALVGTGARLRVLPRILQLFREGSALASDLVGSLSYSPLTPPGAVIEAERALHETAVAVTLGDFHACDRFDLMGRLGDLRLPTLVVVGRDDRLTPPKFAAYLARSIPAARLVEIDGAGHFPQLEQPVAVNEALRGFLGALP
jgi:pimeloyl-ACP methyl ester carboxylesterase